MIENPDEWEVDANMAEQALREYDPAIIVDSDYDGYFEQMVRSWIDRKRGITDFKHKVIRVSAGPYRSDAVTFVVTGDEIHFDFYSALRTGFGRLTEQDVAEIIELI